MGTDSRTSATKVAAVAGLTGAGLGLASVAGSVSVSAYFARLLLTPERERPQTEEILAVDPVPGGLITLRADEVTAVPGRYGLWFDRGEGHLRMGDIVDRDDGPAGSPPAQRLRRGTKIAPPVPTVTRVIEEIDAGIPEPGPARWDGYVYSRPPFDSLGLPYDDVVVPSEIGDLPAWLVPGDPAGGQSADRWVILVHGRGATRHECLRALPTLHRLGLTSLVPTYRNDPEGPPSADGLYGLGLSEWRDTQAAMAFALAHGATDLVLVGWSMGGAIVLQTLDLSPLAERVSLAVLDAPVIDWGDVIAHQARMRHLPSPMVSIAKGLIRGRFARGMIGVHEPLDVARTNWQDRADEIRHPILLIHSADDDFVPYGPSVELARRRPDLVALEEWRAAGHGKEWNVDPQRWDRVVTQAIAR